MSVSLETPRLILRPLAPADFEAHAAFMADPCVAEFLSLDRKPQSRAMAWRNFASMIGHWTIRGFGFFSVFEKATGGWVGRVGPWQPETWPGIECGWGVSPEFWGKGYAPEAAIAAIRWTFAQRPDLPRIISLIDPGNRNSQAVAAKIGETPSGETYQLETFTLRIWAADRDSWLRRFGQ